MPPPLVQRDQSQVQLSSMHRFQPAAIPPQQHHSHQPPVHPQSMVQSHPQSLQIHGPNPTSQRLHDLLAEIQTHFDGVMQENQALKAQYNQHRDELDQISQQNEEIGHIRRFFLDLERMHHDQKNRYEQEISNLRRELDARIPSSGAQLSNDMRPVLNAPGPRGSILPSTNPQNGFPDVPPPVLAASGGSVGGAFGPPIGSQGSHEHRLPSHPASGPHPSPMNNGLNGPSPMMTSSMTAQNTNDNFAPPAKRIRSDDVPLAQNQRMDGQGMGLPSREFYPHQGTPQMNKPKMLGSVPGGPVKYPMSDDSYRQWQQSPNPNQMAIQHIPPQQQQSGRSFTRPPMQQQQQPPQQQPFQYSPVQYPPRRNIPTGVCDLFDFDTLPGSWKREAEDWNVAFNMANPSVQRTKMKVDLEFQVDHDSVVSCVKFSNDGRFLATGCNNFTKVVDISSHQTIHVLEAKSDKDNYVRSICFSPDGKYIAAGTEDRIIRIWDIAQRTVKFELMGHAEDIYGIDWSRDGRIIVSGSGDATVK
ncbi:general transcription repressor, partial [Nowakowskiella sp. JEL0078]